MATRKKPVQKEEFTKPVKVDMGVVKPAPKDTAEAKKVEDPRRMDDAVEAVIQPSEDGKAQSGPATEVELYAAARMVRREGHDPRYYDLEAISKDLQRGVPYKQAVADHRTQ